MGLTDERLLESFRSHERWMAEAIAEAEAAAAQGEVPVGAVVVDEGRILGRGRNQVESLRDPTAHAEILALGAAAGAIGDWRLAGTTLYVTLEPCTMCCGAVLLARVRTVVFGASDPRAGAVVSTARLFDGNPYRQPIEVVGGIAAGVCREILQSFFRDRRPGISS
jgi:tRNA(adenine34) deaminase